jgi:hypothetical protein
LTPNHLGFPIIGLEVVSVDIGCNLSFANIQTN